MDLYINPALRVNGEAAATAWYCNIFPLCSFHINCSPNFGEELMTAAYPCNAEKLRFSAATTFGARLRTPDLVHSLPSSAKLLMLFQHPQFLGSVEPRLQVTALVPQQSLVCLFPISCNPYHVGRRPSRALSAFGTCHSHCQARAMPSLFIAA